MFKSLSFFSCTLLSLPFFGCSSPTLSGGHILPPSPTPMVYTESISSAVLDKKQEDQALEKAKAWNTKKNPSARIMVVNHHLLADDLLVDTLKVAEGAPIKTIILLSPNHFSKGTSPILTSNRAFKTVTGFLPPTENALKISVDNEAMKGEHGVTGLTGYIHRIYPDATIYPIIQKPNTSVTLSEDLGEKIATTFAPENTLVIFSGDFSHDSYPSVSNFHDITSEEVLKNLDTSTIPRLDADSHPSLRTLFTIVEKWEKMRFTTVHHHSSSEYIKNPWQPDNTSYLTGYYTSGKMNTSKKSVTILFLGDTMLDRYIRQKLDEKGFAFILDESMKRLMRGTDITITNHEGAMSTAKPYKARDDMLSFTFDPKWASSLAEYGVNMASLANNHADNFGKTGREQSFEFLEKSGIDTFGDPLNRDRISEVKVVRGVRIGIIGYHSLYESDTTPIIQEIERLRPLTDWLIVYPHWGVEYKTSLPKDTQPQKAARAFIDAGADLVVGHHPHVVQPMEVYKGKPIFYSLGNFVFDQVAAESVRTRLGVGMVLDCEDQGDHCDSTSVRFTLYPFTTNKSFQVSQMSPSDQISFFSWFAQGSALEDALKEQVKRGQVSVISFQ